MNEMMPQLPDPWRVLQGLKEAIQQNKRPALIIHGFLSSGKAEANLVANTLLDNKPALKLLASPEGRKWLHYWLDNTLDYLQQLAEQP